MVSDGFRGAQLGHGLASRPRKGLTDASRREVSEEPRASSREVPKGLRASRREVP